jgi:two-component system sensor histidine kinase BaeS
MSGRGDHGGPRLRTRILGAMALVVLAGAGTLIVVSLLLAPAIFYNHLEQAGVARDDVLAMHVDEGFATAIVVSTLVGVAIAALVAAAMATLVSRRISGPVAIAAAATTQLASGDYSARVPTPGMGPELDSLAAGVNALAERLEATEGTRIRLMSDLAHELRTPLAAIDATVEALADGVIPADERALGALTSNAQRLSRLVEDLASVSRAQERSFRLALADVDLADLARQAIASSTALMAATGIDVTGPTGPGPVVRADPDRLVEVLGELLVNARNACAEGDSISVSVVTLAATARLTVRDSGAGFDPADADRLFQRFYRAAPPRSPRGGSGIGLTIALSLVEAHGGTLTAASPGPGRGSTFVLELPVR